MLEKPWQEQLSRALASLPVSNGRPRVSVVGIGHELRGDDAAGVTLAQMLNEQAHSPYLQAIEAGPAPENCFSLIFRYRPDLVLFVDAANMGAEAGEVRWLDWSDVASLEASTHNMPLPLLANYLTAELGCPVGLLGIQPADVSMGASLSPDVGPAVEAAARALAELFLVAEGDAVL
jgi:hydrogenase 3 maturation protease